ncbi:MAG: RES domain-containing protein [Acidimicrobiia bacterium]|nr:RES domain-containing protein [Acidimicrobiia bacterium]MCY4434137.1 HEPN-associated N-terminal domain-containing protein [bacterium]
MGYWKNRLIEQMNRDWDCTDESVCGGCVEDDALRTILRENEHADRRCDFCSSAPAAHLDTLLEAFVSGLRNEYENALDGVWWDRREGGFQWNPQWDTWDLVFDFAWIFSCQELLEAVGAALHDITWVEKDFITRRRDDVLIEAWDRFCEAVKHETRFVVWLLQPDEDDLAPGEIPPAKILEHITPLIERLNLVRNLPAGHRVWRARSHCSSPIEHSASELGTVPKELALKANRMSPAGIPMFYGAVDADTAITEVTYASDDPHVSWCQFELTAEMRVVDLTRLPPEPSMFDPELGSMRRQIRFLNMFVQQLSDRVEPDHEQIEYVSTQIVTEYLLHVHGGGDRVRGLVYVSSLAEGACVVLDIPNDHCIDPNTSTVLNPPHLQLVADSISSSPDCS